MALAEERDISEVLVVGERLATTWQETASSVGVVLGHDLEQGPAADRIEQVLDYIPNVQLGTGSEAPSIRGQDSTGVLRDLPGFLGGARPRATLRVDGRDVSFNEFLFGISPLWDMERLEVFRTPQTTTQGRNAIAGALFVQTRDPTYQWEGRARLLAGNYDTRQGSLALAGPVVRDQVALRIAGDIRRSRTSSELGDLLPDADPDRDDYSVWRAKLLVEPKSMAGLRVLGTYVHSTSHQPQLEGVVAPFRERRDPRPAYGVFSSTVDSGSLTGTYSIDPSLKSTTTLSRGSVRTIRHALPGLGQADTQARDLSLESLLEWQAGSALRVLGGINLLRQNLDQDINLSAVLGQGVFTDRQRSAGFFGNAEWRIAPRWSIAAGVRYERDSQRRQGSIAGPRVVLPIDYDHAFDAWLPKVSVSYRLGDAATLGVLVQRAYNPGGTTLNFDTRSPQDFNAERLWNYEAFARVGFADGQGSLSANLFLTQFRDAQRAQPRVYFVPGGGTAFWAEISNVPRARSWGLESQLQWRFGEQLSLRASAGLLDTRITRTPAGAGTLLDKEFARAPQATGSLGLTWQLLRHWSIGAQGRRHSGYFSDDANTASRRIAASTVVDMNLDYLRGNWWVKAYARNLFNRFYLTSLLSPTLATAGEPREYGMSVELRR